MTEADVAEAAERAVLETQEPNTIHETAERLRELEDRSFFGDVDAWIEIQKSEMAKRHKQL